MLHSVKTGQPAGEKVTGMPVFEYLASDPELLGDLQQRDDRVQRRRSFPAALKAYDFSGIGTLVDVAGGHGHVLTSILREYPSMRGVLFDLEHVIAGAGPLTRSVGRGRSRRHRVGRLLQGGARRVATPTS